ncbi:SGNH hydrolase-type esterase domain-containing protein [Aspergillus pseudoustus]|uniref:SGNH hydrolase-type esterase domain-containing protein n=1 Tax=Aspergillus pseudoustus TaxID=1810923 RepID=A0ABR4J0P1_9EURO
MKIPAAFLTITVFAARIGANPVPRASSSPPYFITIGDSTVAEDGGWGNGFLSFVKSHAKGSNRGKPGSTTASWPADGRWDDLVENINQTVSKYDIVVTMQFGHNDQKAISLEEYRDNLESFCSNITALGATPIIITPLTRRNFDGDTVQDDFVEWRKNAIAAAKSSRVKYLDLNSASKKYINSIGANDAATYDRTTGDNTHLNSAGEKVFGRMVADLLLQARSDLEDYIAPDEELSNKISSGEYASGDE